MFSDCLIVSDLDGTFLGADSRPLPRNIRAIEAYLAAGGIFTFATGRTAETLAVLVPSVSRLVNAPLVTHNGAVLFDLQQGQVLAEHTLDFAMILPFLVEFSARYPDAETHIVCKEDQLLFLPFEPLPTPEQLPECYKAVFVADAPTLSAWRAYLAKKLGDHVHLCQSADFLLEMLPPSATKGQMLTHLRAMYPERTIYGIGDFENDTELLNRADVGVCPANAIDSLKAIADVIVCDHTEGAIADLIDRIRVEKDAKRRLP